MRTSRFQSQLQVAQDACARWIRRKCGQRPAKIRLGEPGYRHAVDAQLLVQFVQVFFVLGRNKNKRVAGFVPGLIAVWVFGHKLTERVCRLYRLLPRRQVFAYDQVKPLNAGHGSS